MEITAAFAKRSLTCHSGVADGSPSLGNLRNVRIVMVAESFLPQINGVANTARHTLDRLLARGHEVLVIAAGPGPDSYHGVPVVRCRSVGIPGYKAFPVGLPDAMIERSIAEFKPDLVHLASPFVLGAMALRHTRRNNLPTVAISSRPMSPGSPGSTRGRSAPTGASGRGCGGCTPAPTARWRRPARR